AVAEAEAELRRITAFDGTHARAFLALGRLLARKGDRTGAIEAFRRATNVAPGLVEAQRELGRLAADAKDWRTAIAAYTAVLAWDSSNGPGRAEIQRALGAAVEAHAQGQARSR